MKPYLKPLAAIGKVLILAATLLSCNHDSTEPPGKFVLDGTTFPVSNAYVILEGTEVDGPDTYYTWSLYLASEGVSFSATQNKWKGTGDVALLFLTALNDDRVIPEGSFSTSNDNAVGAFYVGFNVETGDGQKYEEVNNTSFTVSKVGSGEQFTITFSANLKSGKTLSGTYTGLLTKVHY